ETHQNTGIVTDHVTMHHGHRVPSTEMLWPMSHSTNAIAAATPTAKATQSQSAMRMPKNRQTPTSITADQPTRPSNGLGKPSSDPCHDSRFAPHCTSRLKLHSRGASGCVSVTTLSAVSA